MYFNFVTSAYARHSERFRPPRSYFHKLSNTNLIMKRSSLLFRTCIGWLLFGVLFLQKYLYFALNAMFRAFLRVSNDMEVTI